MSYNVISAVYDQDSHIEVAEGFYLAIKPMLGTLDGGLVLDLGCGTGLLTERLASRDNCILGVDLSSRMLQIARARCRKFGSQVKFKRADLRKFNSIRPASAAFACADVVNHFQSERQLAIFFQNIKNNLRLGGFFAFDALNRWCFENYWLNRTYHFTNKAGDIVMECDWDEDREVGTAKMVIYERKTGGLYRRQCVVLRERLYEVRLLERLLRRAGFSRVSFINWSPWSDQHEEESDDRTLWIAFQ